MNLRKSRLCRLIWAHLEKLSSPTAWKCVNKIAALDWGHASSGFVRRPFWNVENGGLA